MQKDNTKSITHTFVDNKLIQTIVKNNGKLKLIVISRDEVIETDKYTATDGTVFKPLDKIYIDSKVVGYYQYRRCLPWKVELCDLL